MEPSAQPINLSKFTTALLTNLKNLKSRPKPDELSKIAVSQAVSFFALVYEKIRNAVEYREDHLMRRAAIERILTRRLTLNPEGKHEAENVLRELLWARYFANGSLGGKELIDIQLVIDKYLILKRKIITGRPVEVQQYLSEYIMDLMTSEIEETLAPENANRFSSYLFFIYQVLRKKVKIEGLSSDQKDAYFLAALEKSFRKSDQPFQRYHLFITFYKPIQTYSEKELDQFAAKAPAIFKKVDETITNLYVESLTRFTRKQLPPFLILFSILKEKGLEAQAILANKNSLWKHVDETCREKYQQLNSRVRTLAIRSFIYVFLTKMVFALILEVPVSQWLYGEVNMRSIGINTLFPPILMLLIVSVFKIPGEENTKNIFNRILDIIDADVAFETNISYMPKKAIERKPILIFGFTVFYSLTFIVTLTLIYEGLLLLEFNMISIAIFIFFVCLVTFFSYRVKQLVNEYRLAEKEGVLTPLVDFFFMPILSLGKFFSGGLARLNFMIFILDFLIEAPFKLIFEVVEEWITFVKKRKEEII
ncbi:hypothetical protein COW57_03185 [Candidatus Roizmanbacteria bacterium CG17_big_fil_post_rev_8_21_14_2_50_39_7]|uniref:Uncharacterized protein n=2 Tax=Candidatus Roizmaniibacteriota TaxID=1752723 RepID=A0A2M7EJT4_9BACT|nr:MAG: hypothetical protein COW57_03185 [Candidatus Roizmanbacteria bacterium CG17_big_fil_post_rev_8_21_14_2_50_39_7]